MPAFDVLVNGASICHAGIDPEGGLHIVLSWRGLPRRGCAPPLELSISGIDGRTEESVRWPTPELQIGDEVTIRIVGAAQADAPAERTAFDPKQLLRQQQEYVRKVAAEWGWQIAAEPGAAPDRAGM